MQNIKYVDLRFSKETKLTFIGLFVLSILSFFVRNSITLSPLFHLSLASHMPLCFVQIAWIAQEKKSIILSPLRLACTRPLYTSSVFRILCSTIIYIRILSQPIVTILYASITPKNTLDTISRFSLTQQSTFSSRNNYLKLLSRLPLQFFFYRYKNSIFSISFPGRHKHLCLNTGTWSGGWTGVGGSTTVQLKPGRGPVHQHTPTPGHAGKTQKSCIWY